MKMKLSLSSLMIVLLFSCQYVDGNVIQASPDDRNTVIQSHSKRKSTEKINSVRSQIKAIQRAKGKLTTAGKKITSALKAVIRKMEAKGIAMSGAQSLNASSFSTTLVKVGDLGYVQAYIYVTETSPGIIKELKFQKVKIEIINNELKIIQAWIPFDKIKDIAKLDDVKSIRPPGYARKRTGAINTEGDSILGADDVRNFLGFDGTGVKVGVISSGVPNLSSAQSTGDLPETIEIDPIRPGVGDDDEGTAMLEIIHDLAPGAALAFSGAETSIEMIGAVNFLANSAFEGAGADIIVDDLVFFEEPFFEDGAVAQAVNDVIAKGVTYISAAGNDALKHYEKNYVENEPDDDFPRFNFHDFGAAEGGASNIALNLLVNSGETLQVFLQWNDTFGGSGNDYSIFIFDDVFDEILGFSDNSQEGTDDPIEVAEFQNSSSTDTAVNVIINRFSGDVNKLLEMYFSGISPIRQFNVPEGSIVGHSAVKGVVAVGAIDASDPGNDVAEPSSSHGPARIFFPGQETRLKPDIAAIDGNIISGAGGFGIENPPGTFRFFGTSAAAAHAAAVAALILNASPNLTPEEVMNALKMSAVDLGTFGADNTFGNGRIDAFGAIESVTEITLPAPKLAIDNQMGDDGDMVTFTVSISNVRNEIRELQFNIEFDNDILIFEDKEDSVLASNFDQFNVALDTAREGVLIIDGVSFGTGIPAFTNGELVRLTFSVNRCQEGEQTELQLIELQNDVSGFLTENGLFRCSAEATGPISTPSPTPTPISAATPSPTPTITQTPIPAATPSPTPTPRRGKRFAVNCNNNFVKRPGGLESLVLQLGEIEQCMLKINNFDHGTPVKISINMKTGLKSSVEVDPVHGVTDGDGKLEFTISALDRGVDWIAWAVPDENGEFRFTRDAYDDGLAWGVFVEVR